MQRQRVISSFVCWATGLHGDVPHTVFFYWLGNLERWISRTRNNSDRSQKKLQTMEMRSGEAELERLRVCLHVALHKCGCVFLGICERGKVR